MQITYDPQRRLASRAGKRGWQNGSARHGDVPMARSRMMAALLCALLALPLFAAAQPAAPVDPTLAFAVTAGHWEANGRAGAYRVLVLNAGFEHVSNRVVAQWIADPAESAGVPAVSSERELVAPGSYSFGAPKVVHTKTGIRVTLRGVVSHSPDRVVSCVIELYPQGEVKVVRPCG